MDYKKRYEKLMECIERGIDTFCPSDILGSDYEDCGQQPNTENKCLDHFKKSLEDYFKKLGI